MKCIRSYGGGSKSNATSLCFAACFAPDRFSSEMWEATVIAPVVAAGVTMALLIFLDM